MEKLTAQKRLPFWITALLLLLVLLGAVSYLRHTEPDDVAAEFLTKDLGLTKFSDLGMVALFSPLDGHVSSGELRLAGSLSQKSASEQIVWRIWNTSTEIWGVTDTEHQDEWTFRQFDQTIPLTQNGEPLPEGTYTISLFPKHFTDDSEDYVEQSFRIDDLSEAVTD